MAHLTCEDSPLDMDARFQVALSLVLPRSFFGGKVGTEDNPGCHPRQLVLTRKQRTPTPMFMKR